MGLKLGEALVKEGLITRQQLNRALERQVMFGSRIGTNLLELRFIQEEELTRFLSRHFNVPAVTPDMVSTIPDDVLNAINREAIEKYKILPFKKERRRLHTAMLNPGDLKELDELRFVTGQDIVPYVISELRLLYFLEKYYGIKRELRYISLSEPLNLEGTTPDREKETIEGLRKAFAEVKETEEIAGLLLKEAHKIASRVAVFTLRGGKVVGWKSRGLDVAGFETTEKELSIFSEVLKTKTHYRGPLFRVSGNDRLIEILSGTPQDVLLMPIQIREKVVALLYADNGNVSVLNANIGYLSRLASMAALAFEIILLRKKIFEQ